MTAEQVLRTTAEKLRAAQIENASFDASCLVENITGLSRTKIMLCDDDIADEQAELVERAVLRRISGEPLQYILGEWDFFGRTFEVGEGVLVPRPETELLVELALEKLRNVRYPCSISAPEADVSGLRLPPSGRMPMCGFLKNTTKLFTISNAISKSSDLQTCRRFSMI